MGKLLYLTVMGGMILMFATGRVGFPGCGDVDLAGFSIESSYAKIVDALNSRR